MEVPPSDTEEVPEDYKVAKERRQKITAAREKTRPDNPTLVAGQGKNGKLGNNLTAHIMKGLIKSTIRNQDPREEILKHAKEAAENPYWVAPAYKNGHVLAKDVYENDLERKREESKRRRK